MSGDKNLRSEQEIRADIAASFAHWDRISQNGCADPFYPDGVNMNLIRNHIIFYYQELQELHQQGTQVSLFDDTCDMSHERPLPPKVPEGYMVPNGTHFAARIGRIQSMYSVTHSMSTGEQDAIA